MSLQEIKDQLVTLPRTQQDEVIAFLFHLRHEAEEDDISGISRRSQDANPAHWLSPEEFERQLDQKIRG